MALDRAGWRLARRDAAPVSHGRERRGFLRRVSRSLRDPSGPGGFGPDTLEAASATLDPLGGNCSLSLPCRATSHRKWCIALDVDGLWGDHDLFVRLWATSFLEWPGPGMDLAQRLKDHHAGNVGEI